MSEMLERFAGRWTVPDAGDYRALDADYRYLLGKIACLRYAASVVDAATTLAQASSAKKAALRELGRLPGAEGASDLVRHGSLYRLAFLRLGEDGSEDAIERLAVAFPEARTLPELSFRLGIVYGNTEQFTKMRERFADLVRLHPETSQAERVPAQFRHLKIPEAPQAPRHAISTSRLAWLNLLLVPVVALAWAAWRRARGRREGEQAA